jgi:glucose/arabinose dehydrogenase
MRILRSILIVLGVIVALGAAAVGTIVYIAGYSEQAKLPETAGYGAHPTLPSPDPRLFPTVHFAKAAGWPAGMMPTPAKGLAVAPFADHLAHPRWLYVLPNHDVLVAETDTPWKPDDSKGLTGFAAWLIESLVGANTPSANRITLLRDTKGTGKADFRSVFVSGLNSPLGMTLVGNDFYVADTDAVLRFTYHDGDTHLEGPGTKIVDLPAGRINHHWTKNVIASADGTKLYVSVGSNSNVGENGAAAEEGRAAIWEIDLKSGTHRVFAFGIRNPVGLAWEPDSGKLWTAVNERDEIGSDLVPDYMTSVKDGGFYGWPYSYYGQNIDIRPKPPRPDLVAKAIAPDYALGAHTASLGLTFHRGDSLGPDFTNGAFVGQHGSWNRRPAAGYRVIFIPFANGMPSGDPVPVLTGFLENGNSYGRPVGVMFDSTGALLVADDVGNTVWRVTKAK